MYIFRDKLVALGLFVRPGDVFMDIGPNVGLITMKAAMMVGETGVVIAVEPFHG